MTVSEEVTLDNATIRVANRSVCLRRLRNHEVLSVVDLARLSGLSRPTTQAILHELYEEHLVEKVLDSGRQSGEPGRPARKYKLVTDSKYLAGIDVGVHTLRGLVADLRGNILCALEVEARSLESDGGDRATQVKEFMTYLAAKAGIAESALAVVVYAIPGVVEPEGRVVISTPVPEWTERDLAEMFRGDSSADLIFENDINLAALAEYELGVAKGSSSVFYVHIGHRMNAGFILNGELHRGSHQAAGHIADIEVVDWLGLEEWNLQHSGRGPGDSGDSRIQATQSIEAYVRQVVAPISIVSSALDPDLIVIGGGASMTGNGLVDKIRAAVVSIVPPWSNSVLESSTLDRRATVLGALVRAFQVIGDRYFGSPRLPRLASEWEVDTADMSGSYGDRDFAGSLHGATKNH